MSETKFTRGPWWIDEDENDALVVVGPRDKCKRNGVPNTWEMCRIENGVFWDDAETKREDTANAHLIAAAPALYAALDEAINYLAIPALSSPEASALLDRCTAALSQARGEK